MARAVLCLWRADIALFVALAIICALQKGCRTRFEFVDYNGHWRPLAWGKSEFCRVGGNERGSIGVLQLLEKNQPL